MTTDGRQEETPADQCEVIRFLSSGAAWPGLEFAVEHIETHAARVFLTPDRAWKLKKSVSLPWVDLTSLAARERACREELRLNRELAGPDVYLGVTPVVRRDDGSLGLGAPGKVLDWLLEMRRLPASRMLDRRLSGGPAPTAAEIAALGDVLLRFYKAHPAPSAAGEVFAESILRQSRINADHLREMRDRLGAPLPDGVIDRALKLLEGRRGEILARAERGLLVDGHGDLRPEHVCLLSPPVVIDRLDFDSRLRQLDTYDEVNSLGLDCARLGTAWIREALLARLGDDGFDRPSPTLLLAYGLYRCLTRARLALDHLRGDDRGMPERWAATARACLAQAQALATGQ